MTIHLPKDVERSIEAAVHSGHFASVDAAMVEAARLLLQTLERRQTTEANDARGDAFLGSMRDAADELDEIVADAYRKRREETWRDIAVE